MQDQNPQQSKTHPQKVNIRLEPTGQLNFEGELNQENAEILERLLQQAEYYRAKTQQVETQNIEAKQHMDSVTMTFVGVVLCLLMFGSYSAVKVLSNLFSHSTNDPTPTATNYRVYQP